MTKAIKLRDNHVVYVDTDFEDIDDYFASVPTQDHNGENCFYAEEYYSQPSAWYPIGGARWVKTYRVYCKSADDDNGSRLFDGINGYVYVNADSEKEAIEAAKSAYPESNDYEVQEIEWIGIWGGYWRDAKA